MHDTGRMSQRLAESYREDDRWNADARRRLASDGARPALVARSRRLALVVAAVGLASLALATQAAASPRTGPLLVTKECSQYTGQAGSFCTFTSSNVNVIEPGDRIVYADAAGATLLDTDVRVETNAGAANGHCRLDFTALPGVCTFSGGTGRFIHFQANVSVSVDGAGLWHWDGTYAFRKLD